MRTHQTEFPDIEVPEEILKLVRLGKLTDTSWHNDVTASFEVYGPDGQGFRLWVSHRDPDRREMPMQRFVVNSITLGHDGWSMPEQEAVLDTESMSWLLAWWNVMVSPWFNCSGRSLKSPDGQQPLHN